MKRIMLLAIALVGCIVQAGGTTEAAPNYFRISSYSIDYTLDRDDERRSKLTTTESITANFSVPNQNHGIERAIPLTYNGHTTNLTVVSVTNALMQALPYTTYEDNQNLVIRIGDANAFVSGEQTYRVTYTQRDVTRYFDNTSSDEFYWDTNGVDWRVPIDQLTVRLHVDDSISTALNGQVACYQGVSGSTVSCTLNRTNSDFEAVATNLNIGENISIAVGFEPGTFNEYQPTFVERMTRYWIISLIISIPLFIIGLIILLLRYTRWTNRSKEQQTIVTEFLPPKDFSITTSASVLATTGPVFTAQLLDFAVRRYIKIFQTREKKFWRSAEYEIEVIRDISTLKAEEIEIITDIFGQVPALGQRLALSSLKNNTALYGRMRNNDKDLQKLVRTEYALRQKNPVQSKWFTNTAKALIVIAIVSINPLILILAITSFALAYNLWPLTDTGLALARYMNGLKQYISVAETERLKQLQSPEGALKLGPIDSGSPAQLVKLYEAVLPYSVLFKLEKDWNKQLGSYYESIGQSPDWYASNTGVFNAALFSIAMSNFNSAASYSSASSSSSGGSSGGGSSGGGGGGGGGGGW